MPRKKVETNQVDEVKVDKENMDPAKETDEVHALRDLVDSLTKQVKEQGEELRKAKENSPVIQMVSQDVEKVVMRFQAEVADENLSVFGANGMYGQVTGKRGTVVVPKSEWSRFYTESVRRMIDHRWLVVLSGMTDEERKFYNCNYEPGEIMDERLFGGVLDEKEDRLLELFENLCTEHQEMIGKRFIEAFEKGDPRANDREKITKLNELSKKRYLDAEKGDPKRKGIFWPIIEGLNRKESETV